MLYCGKPPKEKYKKTGENTELTLKQVPAERLSGLNGDFNF